MKHILLPTDFSDNAWIAIQYAIHFFKNENTTFHIVHTYRPLLTPDHFLGHTSQVSYEEAIHRISEENLTETLEKIQQEFGNTPNHIFQTHSLFNTITDGLNQVIKNHKVDLVIMGTQGATGAKEVFLGSNTVHVIKKVKCAVLAIPSNFEYKKPSKILFPNDLEVDYDNFKLDVLKNIALSNQSEMHVLHVHTTEISERRNQTKEQLKQFFEGVPFTFHLHKGTDVLQAIDQFQKELNADLLTMLRNKHTFLEKIFFKSNIDQIGYHITKPFLVIPMRDEK